MITAKFLTCNKKIQNCFFADTFKASLNCRTNFIKSVQIEASEFYIIIYFCVFIIGIWNYQQKYYKMTWHAFGTRIYTKFTIEYTQLFISFVPKNFSSAINNLQSTITLISSWMSSNYLTLDASKTEFLLIGLPQQTSKIVNPSPSLPTTKPIMPRLSAKNLGFIFDSTLSFSKQISFLFSACHYHIRDLRHIRHTLDSTTATTIATALVSITVTPFTTVYPSLKLSAFNIFKMDLHELLLAPPNILTSPQCSSSFIGSKLNNGFNIRSS